MKMQIILLYAGQYDMTDDSGKRVQGTSVNYYFNTDLVAEDNVNGTKGTRPAKSSCEFQVMGKIKRAPALYDAEFSMSIGSDGKPVLKIIDLDYISDVQITPVPDSQFDAKQEPDQKPDKKVSLMILSTSSEADFDTEFGEAYTLEDGEENISAVSRDHDFAIVVLLFLGVLIGVCLIGRRRWHD